MVPDVRQFKGIPAGTGQSSALPAGNLLHKTIQVEGTFTATFSLQGRAKGATAWVNIGTAITAPGIVEVSETLHEMRVDVTSHTSGTPIVWLQSFREPN